MAYSIYLKPSAQKDLDSLPDNEAVKVSNRIFQLANEPRPIGVQKLTASEGFRIRSGDYRILYEIDDNTKKIIIYRVKNRKDVYR